MTYTALSHLTNQENLTHNVCFDEQHTYVSYEQFQHDVQRVCGYLSHQPEKNGHYVLTTATSLPSLFLLWLMLENTLFYLVIINLRH